MQKWEYCVITGVTGDISGFLAHYPRLVYFSLNGISSEMDLSDGAARNRPKGWEKVSEAGYVAHVIAQLGL